MKHLTLTFFCLSILSQPSLSLSPHYAPCQLQKSSGESVLAGCPDGTLYVSSTDPNAKFKTIQTAINSLPETGLAVILIGEGEYYETLDVSRSAPLTLLGQLDPATAYASTGNASQRNLVNVWNHAYVSENSLADEKTSTLTVAPSPDFPFGSVDFRVYNIDFENRAANRATGPALVTSITLANASFYGCSFDSWQDTFYSGFGSNTYVTGSIIHGQVDYIFGYGRAWFQSVTLASRACGGGITAWQGTPGTSNGVYIVDSNIIRSPDADPATVTTGQCFLGRPWNKHAVAVFLRNYMDESINTTGFTPWYGASAVPDTTFFAEFDSHGEGGDTSARIPQEHILNSMQARKYGLKHVFHGLPEWIDFAYQ